MKIPVSVVVLAKNEAHLIARCVRSVAWADEVLVLDSGSTDDTRRIAAAAGATVYEQKWLGWVPQRQRGIELARNDWIFVVEADEIVDERLGEAVQEALSGSPDERDGYYLVRRDEFAGRLLPEMRRAKRRRAFIRIFNRRFSHYNPAHRIHEEVLIPGRAIPLPGTLLHWRMMPMLDRFRGNLANADLEAAQLADEGVRATPMKIMVRPVARFLWCYLLRGGFRAGTAGLLYSMIRAEAEFVRYATLWDKQCGEHLLDPPPGITRRLGDRARPVEAGEAPLDART